MDTLDSPGSGPTALKLATALVLLLASSPAAAWRSAPGDLDGEPNALPDLDPAYQHQHANGWAEDRVYFDAHLQVSTLPYVPHPSRQDTAPRTVVATSFSAYLGAWRDCNADGFIGDAVTGVTSYPAELALAVNEHAAWICPEASAYWDGTTVHEFLPIGPDARDLSTDPEALLLCPDRHGGPSGDPTATPRARDSSANLACLGPAGPAIQDGFARVWHDWGWPTHGGGAARMLVPLPDGTLRESNGAFAFADTATFGRLSRTHPWWPAADPLQDPAYAGQCRTTGDALDLDSVAGNALDAVGEDCSPMPNVARFGLPAPIGAVAWPGHLAEDRVNDSEARGEPGTPITEPFPERGADGEPGTEDDCQLDAEPDRWDEDHDDGDPIHGYHLLARPVDLSAYLSPQEEGPALGPTLDGLAAAVAYHAYTTWGAPAGCGGAGLEIHAERQGRPAIHKASASTLFAYEADQAFHPSDAGGQPGTCLPTRSTLRDQPTRCSAAWYGETLWVHTHGLVGLAPYPLTTQVATFYADVSFGDTDGFDIVGDGPFHALQGIWEPAPLDLDPGRALPAGRDDAHAYGDEHCTDVTSLTHGTDSFGYIDGSTHPRSRGSWSCDRNEWAATAGLECWRVAVELACYRTPLVGDTYDLRDVECRDNEVADREHPLAQACELGGGA